MDIWLRTIWLALLDARASHSREMTKHTPLFDEQGQMDGEN